MTVLEIKHYSDQEFKRLGYTVPHNTAMDWTVCLQNSYAEAETLNAIVFGDSTFRK